jgi:parallel beta-helix repeat protein
LTNALRDEGLRAVFEEPRLFLRLCTAFVLAVTLAAFLLHDRDEAYGTPQDPPSLTQASVDEPPRAALPRSATEANEDGWVVVAPGDNLQALAEKAAPGQGFYLRRGVYRLLQVTPKDGQTFYGEQGAVLNGARELKTWHWENGRWFADGQTQKGQSSGYCAKGYDACTYPEDLFIDDKLQRRVAGIAEVKSGTWYFDYNAQRVWVLDDPRGHNVEVGVSRFAFGGTARNVVVQGLVIEKYASPAQFGAIDVHAEGSGWVVEANEIRQAHGAAIRSDAPITVRGNRLHANGQEGIRLNGGTGSLVEDNLIFSNGTVGFDSGWEAGGAKFLATDALTVRKNAVYGNQGAGLWTDGSNNNTVYDGNKVYDNAGQGIMHEISYAATIANNEVYGNGLGFDAWLWGAQILVANSPNVEVFNNNVTVPAEGGDGIAVLQSSDRGKGRLGAHVTTNAYVHHNTVRYLGKVGSSGGGADIDRTRFFGTANNRFDHNTYIVPDEKLQLWEWRGARSWTGFKSQGQEPHGRVIVQ